MSAFTNQEPMDRRDNSGATSTIDPMSMWPGSDPSSATPSTTGSRHDSAYSSSETPKTAQTEITAFSSPGTPPDKPATQLESPEMPPPDGPLPSSFSIPTESETSHRARYAANQRHSKTRNNNNNNSKRAGSGEASKTADEKKKVLREKNKVAAAKCRQRQRRQAETIRSKGARLSEDNAQLKSYVQELRQELNALRAYALGHGECDARLAAYNHAQADRVLAEYYSSACSGGGGGPVRPGLMAMSAGLKDEPQP